MGTLVVTLGVRSALAGLAAAGALASRQLGLLLWGSAAAVELTAFGASLSRSLRRA